MLSLVVLVLSAIVIYFVSRRYKVHTAPFILGNGVGFVFCALMGTLIFGFVMDPSAIFTDFSLLGGGLGWTAAVVATILVLRPIPKPTNGYELTSDNLGGMNYSVARAFWTLVGLGIAAVGIAILGAVVVDFIVFFIYGSIGLQLTEINGLLALIAHIIYVLVCMAFSYFVLIVLLRRKTELIQTLYFELTNSVPQAEQEIAFHEDKPKRKFWLWGCGGSLLLLCVLLGAVALYLFSPSNESYPLDGEVSFPSTVKKGDNFDFVVTLTNSTTNPIFIKHIVLHRLLNAPSLLDGAIVTGVEPVMNSEILVTSRNDVQYSYFHEIKAGETQTVIFHMQAVNTGIYYENVGVYAKDPSRPEPAFVHAFHFTDAAIEITP